MSFKSVQSIGTSRVLKSKSNLNLKQNLIRKNKKIKSKSINGLEFTITKGIIDVTIENKLKHLCVSIASSRLPTSIRIKEHEYVDFNF